MLRPKKLWLVVFRRTLMNQNKKTETARPVRPPWAPIRNTINIAFGKYLLVTNIVSSGILMFLGDIAQQEIEYQQKKLSKRYDFLRLLRMFGVGLALGPMHHYYYDYINRILPKTDVVSISKKILADQCVMSPVCIVGFFYMIGLLETKTVKECSNEINDKFLEVYKTDWCVWPPAQYLNFYFVSPRYQVFVINALTMVYNIYLSYVKHRELAEEHALTMKQI